jgi:hypothetical protein
MRKPFDVLVEGPFLKNSRGKRTAIELFRRGLATWDDVLLRTMNGVKASDAEG